MSSHANERRQQGRVYQQQQREQQQQQQQNWPNYVSFDQFLSQHGQQLAHNNGYNNSYDYNAAQLRPTAPEFVPRFQQLSLQAPPSAYNASYQSYNDHGQQQKQQQQRRGGAQRRRRRNNNDNNEVYEEAALNAASSQQVERASGRHNPPLRNNNDQQRYNGNGNGNGNGNWRQQPQQESYEPQRGRRQNTRNAPTTATAVSIQNQERVKSGAHRGNRAKQQPTVAEPEQTTQRGKLAQDIERRRLECLVCVDYIKDHHFTWSCESCYHVFHLKCIKEWASASLTPESSAASNVGWRCPACQHVELELPTQYNCFCGNMRNPPLNQVDLAHSCGEMCTRKRRDCAHPCTQRCHPGRCPPCQATVQRQCGCGRTTQPVQCHTLTPLVCGATCDKLLNCALHKCAEPCHQDDCAPCAVQLTQTCYCAASNTRTVACTIESNAEKQYACEATCSKPLACGNHQCDEPCHRGDCPPCKTALDVIKTCPCGKLKLATDARKSCLEPIITCGQNCGKILACGSATKPHKCVTKCHAGRCPPCNKQTEVQCRCGQLSKHKLNCRELSTRADDVRCQKRCTKLRACGRHKCNQDCCIELDHACPLSCNRSLACGKHKCELPCHRGNCPPCPRVSFDELRCTCGRAVVYPPVPCGTKRPSCTAPCQRAHGCAHAPQHTCHADATCPPCVVLTTKPCYGQHESRSTIPCHQGQFSCGMPCGKLLRCGRHNCLRKCHADACEPPSETLVCKQKCTLPRAQCGHNCNAPCHDGECPVESICKELIEVQCACGHRKQMRVCEDLRREYSRITTAQLASSMMDMQRGNMLNLNEIFAPVKLKGNNKTLECNDECRLIERNKRLEAGLGPSSTNLVAQTKYSDFLRKFAKQQPELVKSVYGKLAQLVELTKSSQQRSRSHSFPIMNREKRQMVHELCEMFGIESVAYDNEPNRNVVATAHKSKCWLPPVSIMDVMRREAGQPRVIVPSMNAWGGAR